MIARPQACNARKPQAKRTDISVRPNTENFVKSDNQVLGHRTIWGSKNGGEHEQYKEFKLNMGDPEDTLIRTNKNTQNKHSNDADNNQSNKFSVQGTLGEKY